jgi:hypothetical protein
MVERSTTVHKMPLLQIVDRAGRKPNARLRTREYLIEPMVERLIKVASGNRHGQRDTQTMSKVSFADGRTTRASPPLGAARRNLEPFKLPNGVIARWASLAASLKSDATLLKGMKDTSSEPSI